MYDMCHHQSDLSKLDPLLAPLQKAWSLSWKFHHIFGTWLKTNLQIIHLLLFVVYEKQLKKTSEN